MLPIADEPDRARRRFPFVVGGLVLLNVAVFLYELSLGPGVEAFVQAWAAIPEELSTGVDRAPQIPVPVYATLITSLFLHGGVLHLLGNMIFLWVFGDNVEDRLGHGTFLLFYLAAGIAAIAAHMALDPSSPIPALGASGAIAGVLAAYYLLFPAAQVRALLTFGPVITIGRVSALLLIGFWFLLQLAQTVIAVGDVTETQNVAFFAHVGGFLFGLVATGLIQSARNRPLSTTGPRVSWSATFRNWLILAVVGGAVLAITSFLGLTALALLAVVAIALLALVDGLRRAAGSESTFGLGKGSNRALAFLQLLLSLLLLGNLALGFFV